MESQKQRFVFKALDSGDICVFPSEVSARFWAVQYALSSEQGALFAERTISIDTFYKRCYPQSEGCPMATAMVRRMFLQQQVDSGLSLPHFLRPGQEESHSRIVAYLANILPLLKDVCSSEAAGKLDKDLLADYQVLQGRYAKFLEQHHLFEMTYEEPQEPTEKGRYRILFSSADLGFSRMYHRLHTPSWIIPCPVQEPEEVPVVLEYDNFVGEIKETLRVIRKLLDDGVPCRDIVISTARPEAMLPRLQDEAALYDVPLVVRNGVDPLSYPAGRLFRQFSDLYNEEFSFDTMSALLLETGLPWKEGEQDIHRTLLSVAVDYAIDQGSLHGTDIWAEQLKKHNASLFSWYRTFKEMVIAVNKASSLNDFRKAFHGFQDAYFREEKWVGFPGEQLARFCADNMEMMVGELNAVSLETSGESFLTLFLSYLSTKKYVDQQREQKGINVYRWTDSASISVPHHFILALDWDGAKCVDKPLACLPDTFDPEAREEEDLTVQNLKLAAQDGAILSYHSSDYNGEYLAPSFGSTFKHVATTTTDIYEEEKRFWATGEAEIHAGAKQQRSFSAITLRREPKTSFTDGCPWPESVVRVMPLSSTALDTFNKCPFLYACQYFLGVDAQEFSVGIVDDRTIGNVLHHTYEEFFSHLEGQVFDGRNIDTYREELGACFDRALTEQFGDDGPNPFIRMWIVHTYKPACLKILEQEKETFNRLRSVLFEEKKTKKVSDMPFVLTGKVDRAIALEDGNLAVVDYKKSSTPMSATGIFSTVQLPVYSFLFEHVAIAGYYNIQDGKYVIVWDKERPERKDDGEVLLRSVLEAYQRAFESGTFPVTENMKNCANCDFRPVCRKRYSTI